MEEIAEKKLRGVLTDVGELQNECEELEDVVSRMDTRLALVLVGDPRPTTGPEKGTSGSTSEGGVSSLGRELKILSSRLKTAREQIQNVMSRVDL